MSDFDKIPVAILGATGTVGQRFVQQLANHPWFIVVALCGSDRSTGKSYAEACDWRLDGDIPEYAAEMVIRPLSPDVPARIVFSALPFEAARMIEPLFAEAGHAVCTNASAFRQVENVPLLIPEVNADHLALIDNQRDQYGWAGCIVASPNCTTTGVAMPLKALDAAFGLRTVVSVSMQAISGAGYPGISSMDIHDNVLPYIRGEEEKLEPETRLLLGIMDGRERIPHSLALSAHCNRVPVIDGHTSCVSVRLDSSPSPEEAAKVLADFRGCEIVRGLPSAPERPIVVRTEEDRPQPRLDRNAEGGMAVSIGRVRECNVFDLRFVSLVHNTMRGAASGSILNAELLVRAGRLN